MNFNKIIKYELNYFTNNDELLDSKVIMSLIEKIDEVKFLPNYLSAFTITGMKRFLELSTENLEWKISFIPDKISISKNLTMENDGNLGSIEKFSEMAIIFLNKILTLVPKTSFRLALIEESFTYAEEEDISKIYNNLYPQNDFYSKHIPFEFDWRLVGNEEFIVNNLKEKINCITNLNFEFLPMINLNALPPKKIIKRTLDVNTNHENTNFRFNFNNVSKFITDAIKTYTEISESIMKLLNN